MEEWYYMPCLALPCICMGDLNSASCSCPGMVRGLPRTLKVVGSNPTQSSSFFLSKMTALGFVLFHCLSGVSCVMYMYMALS